MARHPEGWKLRKEPGRSTYLVRFRVAGERFERSTGSSDPVEAARSAERIYADAVQRAPVKLRVVRRGEAAPLDDLISTWLAGDTTLDPKTAKVWESYGRHWLAHWETIADVTDVTCTDYRNERLRVVQGATVRKELGALRRFLNWCHDRGHLPRVVNVPGVAKRVTGKRYRVRRRVEAPDLSPAEVEAVLAKLPKWSTSRKVKPFPIQARFRVQYETGLRPSTIDGLSVPANYTKGAPALRIEVWIDKTRQARKVPLMPTARKALDAVCPKEGVIFGHHDYREHIRAAAKAALPKAAADVFTGAHFRSARITHFLEESSNVPGVQFLVGHSDARSTSRYLRPSFRAAEAVLASFGGHPANSGGTAKKARKRKQRKT